MRFIILTLSALWIWMSVTDAQASESALVDTGYVNAQLVSDHSEVAPGQTFHIALRQLMDKGWHTYWYNPGDSGEPVQIKGWDKSDALTTGEIIWPLPRAIPTGSDDFILINYGFDDSAVFPVPVTVSPDAALGDVLSIEGDFYYLVCEDICVPEGTKLSLNVIVGEPKLDEQWSGLIEQSRAKSPKLGTIDAGIIKRDKRAILRFKNLPTGEYDQAHFFPWEQGIIEPSVPQVLTITNQGLQIETDTGFGWKKDPPETAGGVLRYLGKDGPVGVDVIVKTDSIPDIGAVASAPATVGPDNDTANIGLLSMIFAAFLGGVVLNIMPCVFPIVSLKALSIAKMAHGDLRQVRRDAWMYTIGIIASFLLMTALILMLKAGGSSVGWAFHFQDPRVVGVLAILLFAIGLNLLGVFEVAGGFQNTGQSLTQKGGLVGSFFTGVLAVIVATPCMAPFMAGAAGYAITQSPSSAAIIFLTLGIGFALPYLLIAYIPALSRKLPKPGDWMVKFKEFLAFPMFGAVIWLIWVLVQQSGAEGLWMLLTAMLVLGFAIWLLHQNWQWAKALGVIALLAMAAITIALHPRQISTEGEKWSAERVAELRAQGNPVFVDFTAAWCVPCKVNEGRVLNTTEIKELFSETGTRFLIADWTNRDPVIADELAKFGRAGVPLYLLYPPGNNDVMPEILPQILTKSMIREKIQAVRSN
ncbi:MAG: thiol:disulfide interchange protein [Hellea sp.]|nr:thiol:disulfide interchange protein [Hellea sp.]